MIWVSKHNNYHHRNLCSLKISYKTTRELFYRIMDQVNASLCFVSKTPSAETAKCTVTDRLRFKTGSMEGILETDIKKKGIHEFLIRQSHKLFKHHTANDHISPKLTADIHFLQKIWYHLSNKQRLLYHL